VEEAILLISSLVVQAAVEALDEIKRIASKNITRTSFR